MGLPGLKNPETLWSRLIFSFLFWLRRSQWRLRQCMLGCTMSPAMPQAVGSPINMTMAPFGQHSLVNECRFCQKS